MNKKYKVKYYLQGEVEVEASSKKEAQKQIQEEYVDHLSMNTTGILIGVPKEVKDGN